MKRFAKVYIEISNICNLSCSFCPGTTRKPKRMNIDEFRTVLTKIKDYTDYIYFHLLGEPLCHPNFEDFLKIAEEMKFMVKIVTNGTLLSKNKDVLLNSKSHYRTYISLHSFEANDNKNSFEKYLEEACIDNVCTDGGSIIAMNPCNGDILAMATYPDYNTRNVINIACSAEIQRKIDATALHLLSFGLLYHSQIEK